MKDDFPVVNRKISDGAAPKPCQVIVCSDCGFEDRLMLNGPRGSAAHVATSFARRGWLVNDAGKHLCPQCVARRNLERKERKAMAQGVKTQQEPAVVARSPKAIEAIGELYVTLVDVYDPVAKNYKAGWSDERVAKETGFAVEFVAKRREADLGPVVIDTTVEDFAAELDGIAGVMADIAREHEAQAARIRRCGEHWAKLAALGRAILSKHNAGRAA